MGKLPNYASGQGDIRSRLDSESMGEHSVQNEENMSGFHRIQNDINDIERDFKALGFGQLLQYEDQESHDQSS